MFEEVQEAEATSDQMDSRQAWRWYGHASSSPSTNSVTCPLPHSQTLRPKRSDRIRMGGETALLPWLSQTSNLRSHNSV